jgi:pseudaminic acid biosynthesis-associated methylase
MVRDTYQLKRWNSVFGKKYTDRNALTLNGFDKSYIKKYRITRTAMNKDFLNKMDRSIRILEVGSNIGNQLRLLQKMGFRNLYGIEPQEYATEIAKKTTKGINIIKGSAFDIPFKDKYFDLVFTSGVLIHINPKDLKRAMKEICRCSKKYIWGFEYYSPKCENINYRGNRELLWKADFPGIYRKACPGLKVSKIKFFKYIGEDNTDVMYLLKKP